MAYGKRFEQFITDKKLSPTRLAEELGASRGTIYNYKNGTSVISPAHLKYLKEQYGLNPDWYLDGEGEMYVIPSIGNNLTGINEAMTDVLLKIYEALPVAEKHLVGQLKDLIEKQQVHFSESSEALQLLKELNEKINNRLL